MNKHQNNQSGFSLIELIGVIAIIAILGSLVAPRIFSSIEDAKVTSVVQDAQRLRAVALQFYKDTNELPIHNPENANATDHQLLSNASKIKGWKGPYMEEELQSPFQSSTAYYIASGAYPFDVDGDGTDDFKTTSVLILNGLNTDQAKAISDAIDHDADKTSTAAWYDGGKVRINNSTAAGSKLYIMLVGQ
ncbi:MAG TPA: prepilin-type N-terminal cleavage/methylation domain-containing protein [Mariprofundaceae bacterium]|nr:prepilin-type N-terminal cleavage/methylation domain-containing protein [Mariprofundaceae bacterium]